jgi:hypothetical protein
VVCSVPADVVDREIITTDPEVSDQLAVDGEELTRVALVAASRGGLEGDVGGHDAAHGDHRALVETVLVDAQVLHVSGVEEVELDILDLLAAERELDVDALQLSSIARGSESSERRDDLHLEVLDGRGILVTEELHCQHESTKATSPARARDGERWSRVSD